MNYNTHLKYTCTSVEMLKNVCPSLAEIGYPSLSLSCQWEFSQQDIKISYVTVTKKVEIKID